MRTFTAALLAAVLAPAIAFAEEPLFKTDTDGTLLVRERDGLYCPANHRLRTPEQVVADRLADIAAGRLDRFFCSYDADVKVVMPGSVTSSRLAARDQFLALFGMLGGTIPTVTSLTFGGPVALMTYTVTSPVLSIPDGADTFVIVLGKITHQTVHGSVVFGSP